MCVCVRVRVCECVYVCMCMCMERESGGVEESFGRRRDPSGTEWREGGKEGREGREGREVDFYSCRSDGQT